MSAARTENSDLKFKIDDKRKGKALMLRVMHETQAELDETTRANDEAGVLINDLHERKHKVQLELQNIKESMVKSMEGFSRDLDTVKETIEYNQNSLLEGVRDKLMYSSTLSKKRSPTRENRETVRQEEAKVPETDLLEGELNTILKETGVGNIDELREILDQDEEYTFNSYRDVQAQTEEVELLETDIKHLENDLSLQNSKIEELEQSNLVIQQDLESHVSNIHKLIAKHEVGDENIF